MPVWGWKPFGLFNKNGLYKVNIAFLKRWHLTNCVASYIMLTRFRERSFSKKTFRVPKFVFLTFQLSPLFFSKGINSRRRLASSIWGKNPEHAGHSSPLIISHSLRPNGPHRWRRVAISEKSHGPLRVICRCIAGTDTNVPKSSAALCRYVHSRRELPSWRTPDALCRVPAGL